MGNVSPNLGPRLHFSGFRTPLGQSLKRHRHRQDCKKRKMNTSTNNSLSEEQPLIDDTHRHSSISSQSDNSCSHKNNAAAARTRLAHALLRKNPRRSNTSDLAEITFLNGTENCSTGCGSVASINSSECNEHHRETVQAFSGTNRSLIPTTRYRLVVAICLKPGLLSNS